MVDWAQHNASGSFGKDAIAEVLEAIDDGILILSRRGAVLFANEVAASMLDESSSSHLIGGPMTMMITSLDTPNATAEVRVGTLSWAGESAFLIQLRDITDRAQSDKRMAYRATHHPLTGLPNRYLLDDRLHQISARRKRSAGTTALFYCDLDGLKHINDTYGHSTGDLVLVATARRIQGAVRPEDTVAHISGDEFVIVFENIDDEQAEVLMARILRSFEDPLVIDAMALTVHLSIGFATSHDPAVETANLLDRADRAMYQHKRSHRSTS